MILAAVHMKPRSKGSDISELAKEAGGVRRDRLPEIYRKKKDA
jgi:hypothetical protein